jgi:predicted ATPase/DNA-binding SARP family transcriptional activator
MEFRLLGRLEVEADGADLTPARPKQRALLGALLLRAGQVVPIDELVELLWGEAPPATALTALHGHVSALRKIVGSRLETARGGYRLRLAVDDELDLAYLDALLAAARRSGPLDRSERLGEAMALFRGEPLADLRSGPIAVAGQWARLDELRLTTFEQKADADLELGRHLELIPELERALAEQPLRERLRGQLMLALYRASRQADALQVAQQGRRVLADELGIDPSPPLQRLERQILEQDPSLAAPEAQASVQPTRPGAIVTFLTAELTPASRRDPRRDPATGLLESFRTLVVRHRGAVLAEDPLMAAFSRSSDAVDAALAIQGATRHHEGQPRIGLDSAPFAGRAEVAHEPGARRAIALRRAAHPGQTLLSRTSCELLDDTGRRDLAIADLGEHRLTDLGPARRVYQLDHPRWPARYPAILSLDSRPTNLPMQSGSLVGREREIDQVVALVTGPGERIVTLTGPGGIGKTRLALHVGAEALDRFRHGVHVVDLAPLIDASLVAPTILHALDAATAAVEPLGSAPGGPAGPEVLLILDNFEHLLRAAPVVVDVARDAPGARLLVTSRAPLRIKGEHVYEVGPLTIPVATDGPGRLAVVESSLLFAERARAIRPDFTIDSANARAVADLCRALDGLPLAIELAASRVAVLPPAAFAERRDRALEILTAGIRATSVRHESLRATIAWSYDLLEAGERRLFERLSVFAGGADLAAIEAVCGDGLDTIGSLANLVDLSLVRTDGRSIEPRFSMLDTVRAFAIERLAADDPEGTVAARHAGHYLALAELAEPRLRGDPGAWLDRLEADIDNLRTALDHLIAVGEDSAELALAGSLWRFWYLRGYLTEGRARLEAALSREADRGLARGKALIGAAVMASNLGDAQAAIERATEGLSLNRALGDRWGAAYSAFMLGNAVEAAGDPPRARALLEESIEAFRELGDDHSALLATRSLANSHEDAGDMQRAEALLSDALRLARATRNPRLEASILGILAGHAFDEGRLGDSLWMLRESLRIHAEQGDHLDSAADLSRAARVLAMTGNPATAVRVLASLSALRQEVGGRRVLIAAITDEAMARVRRQLDEASLRAEREAGEAMTIAEALRVALDALPPGPAVVGPGGPSPRSGGLA